MTNRDVLVRFGVPVQKRNDRRIDPIDRSIFRAVPQFAAPHAAGANRRPQVLYKFFRVIARVDDPVVLSEQFLARVFRNMAERIVDVVNNAALICNRDDRGLVECELDIGEGLQRFTESLVRGGPRRIGWQGFDALHAVSLERKETRIKRLGVLSDPRSAARSRRWSKRACIRELLATGMPRATEDGKEPPALTSPGPQPLPAF